MTKKQKPRISKANAGFSGRPGQVTEATRPESGRHHIMPPMPPIPPIPPMSGIAAALSS